MKNALLGGLLLLLVSVTGGAKTVRHYVYFGMDRERLKGATAFLETKGFEGRRLPIRGDSLSLGGMSMISVSFVRIWRFYLQRGRSCLCRFRMFLSARSGYMCPD